VTLPHQKDSRKNSGGVQRGVVREGGKIAEPSEMRDRRGQNASTSRQKRKTK